MSLDRTAKGIQASKDTPTKDNFFLIKLLSRLPLAVLYGLFRVVYFVGYYLVGVRKKIVLRNLRASFPDRTDAEITSMAKTFYRNLCDVFAEALKGFTMSPAEIERRTQIDGTEIIDDYCRSGRSVLLLASHQANWEWPYLALCLKLEYPIHTAYKPPHSEWFERFMIKYRCRFGGEMIPAKKVARDLLRRKDLHRCVAMVADQVPVSAKSKIWLEFLNQRTAFYPGPGKIATSMRLPVVQLTSRRVRRGFYHLKVTELAGPDEDIDAEEITRRYARAVEQMIIDNPTDWFWVHRRWKEGIE